MHHRVADSAGVVLAGGRSTRMGVPKAALEWHGSTLLYRTAALLLRTVGGPVVVVTGPGQQLPELPAGVQVVEDSVEGQGPMCGLATGLATVADLAPATFVCSTDMPFLHPAFIERVLHEFATADTDIVVPTARGFRQPLAAVYRTSLSGLVANLVAVGELRLGMLSEHCRLLLINDQELLADPVLAQFDAIESVMNVNSRNEYESARARPPAPITVECLGSLATAGRDGPRTVQAATLGEVARAVEIELGESVVATVKGRLMTRDPQMPLVAGDTVELASV